MKIADMLFPRISPHPSLISLVIIVLTGSFVLSGCRKDTPPSDSSSTQKTLGNEVSPSPADPFDLVSPPVPSQMAVQRRIKEAPVTMAGPKSLTSVINKARVTAIDPAKTTGLEAQALEQTSQAGIVLGDRVIDIIPPAPYDNGQYLPDDLQLTLPLTDEQCQEATQHNVGAVYLSSRGPVYLDGYYDKANSAVVIYVPHLSGFISFRRDPMQEIKQAIADEASQRAWATVDSAREQLEAQLIESAEEYLQKQAFDKLDGGIKRKILSGLIKNRDDLGNLFASSGRKDVSGFCQSFQVLMGKVIVDNVPASNLRDILQTVTESTETIAAVSEAGGQAAGGDYWAAIEILGKTYSQSTPIYQYTVRAAAIMDAGWSMLKDDAIEVFYQEYKDGTFVPERVSTREDILIYLKRKFPKPKGGKMTDAEVVKFIEDNFAKRLVHEKETALWKAKLEQIHKWYDDRPQIKSKIKERFNNPNNADCFRRFMRILDAVNNRLMRLGIWRSPWAYGDKYMPQPEMVELVNAFKNGGAPEFNRAVKEIERRLAKPLDLEGYSGYWVLADTKRETISSRSPSNDSEHNLEVKAERTGPHAYIGSVNLNDVYISKEGTQQINFNYQGEGSIKFDNPPEVVPNGTNWNVSLQITLKEECSANWSEASDAIKFRLGAMQQPLTEGTRARHVNCYATVLGAQQDRVRVRTEDDMTPAGPTRFSASDGKPWNKPVSVRFTLIPEGTQSTTEKFVLLFEAHTPAAYFREMNIYEWTKDLPKKLEPELHRQISRANFQGVRSGKPDMSTSVQAKSAEPPAPTKTVAGSQVKLTALRYVPEQLLVKKEAAFEVIIENGPRVPSLAWSFGETSPTRTDSWTTVPQCKYTYFKPGTFTVTVKLRDKNNYAKGNLAVGSWQVTVAAEGQN